MSDDGICDDGICSIFECNFSPNQSINRTPQAIKFPQTNEHNIHLRNIFLCLPLDSHIGYAGVNK